MNKKSLKSLILSLFAPEKIKGYCLRFSLSKAIETFSENKSINLEK